MSRSAHASWLTEAASGGRTDPFIVKTWVRAKFARDERGADLVEYMLLVVLIAVAVIVAVQLLGGRVSNKYFTTTQSIPRRVCGGRIRLLARG